MRIFNVFVSSAKRVRLQRQKCSSLDQHKTRSSLAINGFVCSEISYSEVKINLDPPPSKRTKLGGRVSEKNFTSSRNGPEKAHKQSGDEKLQEPYPTTERCRPPLWPPTQCTCTPSLLCYVSKLGMQVHCVGGQRGGRHRSIVGYGSCNFSSPPWLCTFFQVHPYSKWSFSRNFFPLVEYEQSKQCHTVQ